MSTYTSEPGTRLAGRYRLVDQMRAGAGWIYWKATDETLARPVTVLTFAMGFPRLAETVTAARSASRLTDPRFAQVFDVEDIDELAYVVTEWVVGESLLDMLAEGPLDPPRAVALVLEAARALATAHATGLAHRRLDPACVHWTQGGGVKIRGLAMDAALVGTAPMPSDDAEDPELTDTRDLARLLYAALTGYWPGPHGPGPSMLPPAPETDGTLCTPRQVSAAVPANIDAVTCQALFQRPNRHGPALTTPAMFADALAGVAPRSPLPLPAMPASVTQAVPGGYQATGPTNPYPVERAPRPRSGRPRSGRPRAGRPRSGRPRSGNGYRRPAGERSATAMAMVSVVIVLVLAAVGVAAWSISHSLHHTTPPQAGSRHTTAPSAAAAMLLKPVSASAFGLHGGDDGGEAALAIDGDPTTAWHTSYYIGDPVFGGLPKKGTGLILDLGKQVQLSQLVVQFGTSCCAHATIEIGNNNSALSDFTVLSSSDHGQGSTTFNVTKTTTGRYVLIWLTYLPPQIDNPNQFQAFIYNVSLRGAAVTQSG